MNENVLKKKIEGGTPVCGVFVRMGAISVEILGRTGWDYVIVDVEHGVHTMEDVSNMIRAARAAGLTCIVRVPGPAPINIMRCLDAGADGVQIPSLRTLDEVREAVAAVRYHPYGNRGACAYSAATGYSTIPFPEHIATSNAEAMAIVHIENAEAADMIEEILDLGGIDVIFCGPWDLSQSLGIPGRTADPRVTGVIDRVLAACYAKNTATGIFVQKPEDAEKWLKKGVTYIACSVDVGIYADASASFASAMREQIGGMEV
jgi:4-hydroxy-2-oxoheptanedioate aldolase